MKKLALFLGVFLTVVLVGGGAYLLLNQKSVAHAYWDGKSDINQVGQDGQLPLTRAVRAKHLAAVQKLVEKGAAVESKNKAGRTALDVAAESGDVEIYKFLLGDKKTDTKHLISAIVAGDADMVQYFLDSGIGVNDILLFTGRHRPDEVLTYEDPRTVTALKKAVEADKPEIAKLLLEKGAEGAKFFLPQAISNNQVEMVKVLADKVSDVRNMIVRGMDLLSYAGNDAHPDILAYFLSRNVGEANGALERILVHRKADNDFMKTVELFLKAGARPTAESLVMALKKNNQELFNQLAGCMVKPNVKVSGTEMDLFDYALVNGYWDAVYYLLEHGLDVWATDKNGQSRLEKAMALTGKNPELFEHFKAQLKDLNETGYEGETLLMLLAKKGDFKLFQEVAGVGGDIWQKDKKGRSVLMYAALGGNMQIIDFLLTKGDNLASADSWGKTVLMYAAEGGNAQTVNQLLKKGLNPKDLDSYGRSAIMYAALKGHAEVVKLLLNAGESPFFADDMKKSVLMFAAESGDADTIQVLLDQRADAAAMDKNGVSVISYAAQSNSVPAVQKILEQRPDIYAADKNGYQPITYAFKNGNLEMADLLNIRYESARWQTKDNGRTLPMYAVDGGNAVLMERMVRLGADAANLQDNEGQNFTMLMAKYGRPDAYRQLLHQHADAFVKDNNGKMVLMYAAENESGVNLITSPKDTIGISVDVKDNQGKTALMYAVSGAHSLNIKAQTLYKVGADVNAADNEGKTVLMYAVGNEDNRVDLQMVKDLLRQGANVNKRDRNGRTPLMYAAKSPEAGVGVIDTLLQAQANIQVKDNQGKTLLMYAAESGDISKFKLLLSAGAVTGGTTGDGKTVQDFAKENGPCFADAVRALLQ